MSEAIAFPRVRRALPPRGQRVMVVGVDPAIGAACDLPTGIYRMDQDMWLQYVSAWELHLRGEQPDFWIAPRLPSAPGRAVLAETIAGDVLEQDAHGRMWINAESADEGALVQCGGAAREREGELRLGEPAAFLLATRDLLAMRFSVHVTPPLLWIHEQPRVDPSELALCGWMRAAHRLWREQERRR